MTIAHFDRTKGVDPRLVQLFEAIAQQPGAPKFGISEGLRDIERQRQLLAEGKSQTLNSKHLHGGAMDIHLFDDQGNVTWDYPLYQAFFDDYAGPMAEQMGLPMTWGGNWKMKDGVHYQLDDVMGAVPKSTPKLPEVLTPKTDKTGETPQGLAGLLAKLQPEEEETPSINPLLAMAMAQQPQAQIAPRQYTPMQAPEQQDATQQHNLFSASLPWMRRT